jgi:hypothetical protein
MTLDWDQISCKKHAANAPVIRVASTIDNGDHIDAKYRKFVSQGKSNAVVNV